MIILALLSLLALAGVGAGYTLQSNFSGATFFDNFNFYPSWDPTYGFVHYVDRGVAQSMGMINSSDFGPATFGVDHTGFYDYNASIGRASVRLESIQKWDHGLFIVDLAHMPASTCGSWPAMWILGGGEAAWPAYGEIDIIEFTNNIQNNVMALHTALGCTIAGSGQSGILQTNDCGDGDGYLGCLTTPKKDNSAGTDFNAIGGGVYAMEWTSVAIRIWFFPRGSIPASVTSSNPDPSQFGIPDANFEGSCDIDTYFKNGTLIFNIDFCGTWAGPTFVDHGCPSLDPKDNAWTSCNMYVAENPDAFVDTYFAVNYINVYTTTPGTPPPPSSVLSSVAPVASTSSATSGGAEGQTTTHTQSLWPPTSITTTTSTISTTSTSSTIPPPPPPSADRPAVSVWDSASPLNA